VPDGLRQLDTSTRYVFPGRGSDKRMTDVDKALATAVTHDGKPLKITPHVLRKANATWQMERGVPPAVLQPVLGRAPGSRITARHYTSASREAQRAAVLTLPVTRTATSESS
jgi:site-specific recombinase XerD